MNKKIIALGIIGAMAATNVSAANAEFFLSENKAAEIKDGAYTEITNASFKEENGVSYISADTLKNLFGIQSENGTLSYNGKTAQADSADMLPLKSTLESLGFVVKYSPTLDSVFVSDQPAAAIVDGEKIPYEHFKMLYDTNIASVPNATDDMKAQLKENIKAVLLSAAKLSNAAKKSGFDATMQNDKILSDVNKFKELQKTMPVANSVLHTTYANLAETQQLAANYSKIVYAAITTDDEEINKYYAENFVTAEHILIPLQDVETGEALGEKEAKEAEKLAKDILAKIKKGEDFDKLMNTYSKDPGLKSYPNGYTFTKGEMVKEFEDSAFSLKENEVSDIIETAYGYHIIKRLPLEKLGEQTKLSIENAIKSQKYNEYVSNLTKDCVVEINDEAIASIK